MYETYLGAGFVSFDGRVLESWQPTVGGNGRLHVAVIGEVHIGSRRRDHYLDIRTTYHAHNLVISFPREHLPIAEHLKRLIETARARLG